MPQMKFNGKVITVTDTELEQETSWEEKYKLFADIPFYEGRVASYYTQDSDGSDSLYLLGKFEKLSDAQMALEQYLADMEQAVQEMLEPVEFEMFAIRIQQYLQEHDKNFAESVSTIVQNLENGNIDDYVELLDAYAEDLDSDAAEMARDVSVGAEEEADADYVIAKYNTVTHTITQIKNLSFATELQRYFQDSDRNFSESVVTIAENLTNRKIDGYVEQLDTYAESLDSDAAEMARDVLEGAEEKTDADYVIGKYNLVTHAIKRLQDLSKDNDVDIYEPVRTPFFTDYEVASPIIHNSENYVVIHRNFQEYSEAVANEVLYNPSEKTFMFVDTGNDIYQQYNDFALVKKFMTEQEIEKFNEVLAKSEGIEKDAGTLQVDELKEKLLQDYSDFMIMQYENASYEPKLEAFKNALSNNDFNALRNVIDMTMDDFEPAEITEINDFERFYSQISTIEAELADERQPIVKLTGLPVSEEMRGVLQRLENKEHVDIDEINNTKEIKIARSNIDYSRPTIQLDNRLEIQANVLNQLNNFGSAAIDGNGTVSYNGDVAKGSRLDIVIGLPASGKSSAIVDSISQEFNSKVIDNDEAKKMIPQYNDGWGAGVVHQESQLISDRAFKHSLSNQENIVLPKVGSNADKLLKHYIEPAKEAGYTINIHFVDLDRDKALGRMLNRFIEEGRFLDPNLIEKYAPLNQENQVQQSYEQLKGNPLISGFSMWDNDVPREERPILIEHEGLTGNYIDNARKGDDEHGMETEYDRGGESEVVDGGTGRGNGRKERYSDTMGEETQGRDREPFGNRPNEDIHSNLQDEVDNRGTGQDERGRAAGTIQVDELKEELLEGYSNFIDTHYGSNEPGKEDFADALSRNDFNALREVLNMDIDVFSVHGSPSAEIIEVTDYLHSQITELEFRMSIERQAEMSGHNAVGEYAQKRDGEALGNRPIENINGHFQNETVIGGAGEDERGRAAGTILVNELKEELLEGYSNFIDTHYGSNEPGKEDFADALSRNDFNALREVLNMDIDVFSVHGSPSAEIIEVTDYLHSQITELEFRMSIERQAEMSGHNAVGEYAQKRDGEALGNRPIENINGHFQNETVTGGTGQDERGRAAGTIQVDELQEELMKDYNNFINKFITEGESLTVENFIEKYDGLRDSVDSMVNAIGAEDSEYVTDELIHAADSLKNKIDQYKIMREDRSQTISEENLGNMDKIGNVVQIIKEADLSDYNSGEQLDPKQIQAMLITGKTEGLTKAISEFVFASEEEKQNVFDTIRVTKEDIQNSIEKGLDMELYEEKISLLLTGKSLMDDTTFFTDKDSFAADFDNIYSVFNNGIYEETFDHVDDGGFGRLGEEITFTIPDVGEIRLCDIEEASSRYNLPEGYYVAKVWDMEHDDRTFAFNANEIMSVTFHSHPELRGNNKTTEQCNPEFQRIHADADKISNDYEQDEVLEVGYQCYVADDKQAYRVLLSSDPSKEYQERLQFYVEDTDGNAIASGNATSLSSSSAESVMYQIGVFDSETDGITYRLRDEEEIQMMYERSQDITKLPCMAVLTSEYPDKNLTLKEFVFCADNAIASKISEHAMNEHDRLQQHSDQDINFSVSIDVRPDIEEQAINQMLEKTEQYRAYEYYDPAQDAVEFLLVESDKENSRITCTYYDSNLEKTSEAVLNYESRSAFGITQQEFSIFELLNSQEYRNNSDKVLDTPTFKPINADELRSDITDKQALKIGNDVIDRTNLDAGDKIITLYDKTTNEVTFEQAFYDISEVDLFSLQIAAKGWDRYEVTNRDDVLFKGNVTDTFEKDVREELDELEAAEQEADERVLGDRELEPLSNAELATQIANLIYAHDDNLMDISLDDIQSDILTRIEDSIASGDVEQLKELSSRLESVADLMTDEEKTIAAVCAEQIDAMEELTNKSPNLSVSHEHEQATPSGSASELSRREADDENWTMKKIEENEEENFNFIDGTLNNVAPPKETSDKSLHDRIEENKERSAELGQTKKHGNREVSGQQKKSNNAEL